MLEQTGVKRAAINWAESSFIEVSFWPCAIHSLTDALSTPSYLVILCACHPLDNDGCPLFASFDNSPNLHIHAFGQGPISVGTLFKICKGTYSRLPTTSTFTGVNLNESRPMKDRQRKRRYLSYYDGTCETLKTASTASLAASNLFGHSIRIIHSLTW